MVLQSLPQGIILGVDFLRQHNAVVDFQNQVVSFKNQEINLNLLHGKKDQCIVVYLKDNVILDARSETIVPVITHRVCDNDYYLEPLQPSKNQRYTVACALVRLLNGMLSAKLLNIHDTPITLKSGTKLALLESLKTGCTNNL